MFSKHEGLSCAGIQIHVLDRGRLEPVKTALRLISEVLHVHPEEIEFRVEAFDRLIGNGWVREALEKGDDLDSIQERWSTGLEAFKKTRERYLLY